MRLAIPKKIKVAGRWWSVRRTSRRRKRGEMRGLAGLCDRETRTIWIDAKLTDAETSSTFVHELLHACLPDSHGAEAAAEERLVTSLEEPLTDLILRGVFVSVPDEVP